MTEISKEAWGEARELTSDAALTFNRVAAALQRHMDATAFARLAASALGSRLLVAQGAIEQWQQSCGRAMIDAEAAEARARELQEHRDGCAGAEATINDLRQQLATSQASIEALKYHFGDVCARKIELERQVTELQTRGTELVLQNRLAKYYTHNITVWRFCQGYLGL